MTVRPLERGAVRKDPGGRLRVALVYPNAWRLGMANLGLHAVYRLVNDDPRALCERVFLPEAPAEKVRSLESGRPLSDFDVVAFSLSFEEDYGNVLALLDRAGFPLRAADRDDAIHQIRSYVQGQDEEAFASDRKTQGAVIRNLEIIGEAAGNLLTETKENAREVDWRKSRGTQRPHS